MSRFVAGGTTTAGSTTLPIASLYSSATTRPWLTAMHVYNLSSTAVSLRMVRLSTTGTRGTAWTSTNQTQEDLSPVGATASTTHTAAPTISADLGYRFTLGAAVGSGVLLTWPDRFLTISSVANNGIGLVVETGTGQACQVTFEWGE